MSPADRPDHLSGRLPMFFIVGRPRSGTTLLRTIFDAHPQVNIPPECQFIVNLLPKYGKKTQWSENDLAEFQADLNEQWLFSTWKITPEKLQKTLSACKGQSTYAEICQQVYLSYSSVFQKEDIQFLGDKNPGYLIYTRQLSRLFPDARFIHIVRDYRDHFVSIRNVDFDLPVVSLIVSKWRHFVSHFHRLAANDPESYTEVRYEELVSEPEKTMHRLCAFAGITFHPDMLEFHREEAAARAQYDPQVVDKIHARLFQKISTDKTGVYERELTLRQIRQADFAVGSWAQKMGYKKQFKHAGILTVLSAVPGILLALCLRLLTKLVDHFPWRLRAAILNKWPLRVGYWFNKLFRPSKSTDLFKAEKKARNTH